MLTAEIEGKKKSRFLQLVSIDVSLLTSEVANNYRYDHQDLMSDEN